MGKYRLLALDLDGTLLNTEKEISSITKTWLNRTKQSGVEIIFTTGRGIQRVQHLREQLKLHSPMVLLNGAEIWKDSNQVLERHFIEQKDIINLHSMAIQSGSNFWGYSVHAHVGWEDWTDDMFDQDWMKFGLSHPNTAVIQQLRQKLKTIDSLKITNSAENNIECSKSGLSKEYGIKKICNHLGINIEEVMAVGDNMNDFEIIKEVGLGVAMDNSPSVLKEIADDITDTNDNDGVAKAVEKHLFSDVKKV